MGKIVNEVKINEINDGFSIEIKGDKEAIRKILDGFGSGFSFERCLQFCLDPGFWGSFAGWCSPWLGAEEQDQRA